MPVFFEIAPKGGAEGRETIMIEITDVTVKDRMIPEAFNGFRILQLSDLHDAMFGRDQKDLLDLVRKSGADLAVLTGDFVGGKDSDLDRILRFMKELSSLLPCCYVTGNHETRLEPQDLDLLLGGMSEYGIEVLRGRMIPVCRGKDSIQVLGIDDPGFINDENYERDAQTVRDAIQSIPYDSSLFTLLLSHRPEVMGVYAELGIDLVLCGHTHGGQLRIPGIGAFYVPMQGWFPKYDCGMYREGKTRMYISRGLGTSVVPFRLFNPPELVLITLKCDTDIT